MPDADRSGVERLIWCGSCQDHFDREHDDGYAHHVGHEFGPTGSLLQTRRDFEHLLAVANTAIAAVGALADLVNRIELEHEQAS